MKIKIYFYLLITELTYGMFSPAHFTLRLSRRLWKFGMTPQRRKERRSLSTFQVHGSLILRNTTRQRHQGFCKRNICS